MASFELMQARQEAHRFRTLATLADDPTLIASYSRIAQSYDRLARVMQAREPVHLLHPDAQERGIMFHTRLSSMSAQHIRMLHAASGA